LALAAPFPPPLPFPSNREGSQARAGITEIDAVEALETFRR